MKQYEKERYWTFIMYPDSRPDNWKEFLQETGLQIGISPLHDKDKNADDTQKKEHYHVLLTFKGPTTYKRVAELIEPINGTIPKRVVSPIGMVRYFTHKDNPEKAQYNEEEIISINGFDIKDFDGITKTMEMALKEAIIDLIIIKDIYEYSELIEYLKNEKMKDMLDIATNKTIFLNTYITSRRHRKKEIDMY